MSVGNVGFEMMNMNPVSVGTVYPYPVFNTTLGAALMVGGLAAATTWVANYFNTIPNGCALGCIYIDVVTGTTKVNIGTVAAPVWSVIS